MESRMQFGDPIKLHRKTGQADLASGHPLIRAFVRPVLVALNVLGRSERVEASVSYGLLY